MKQYNLDDVIDLAKSELIYSFSVIPTIEYLAQYLDRRFAIMASPSEILDILKQQLNIEA